MNAEFLRVMLRLAFDKYPVKFFYQMRMTLYQAPFGESFVASDQPVVLYHTDLQYRHRDGASANVDIQLSLLLTSRLLIQLDISLGPHAEPSATSYKVRTFNRCTVVMEKNKSIPVMTKCGYLTWHSGIGFSVVFLHMRLKPGRIAHTKLTTSC